MRVIAGKARRLPLIAPAGEDTRPTTDRIKETLFNILQDEIPGCRFLDLFAGSGGIGIEALSRGAAEAVFVENDRRAWQCIETNLSKTRLDHQAEIIRGDVMGALGRFKDPFDIIFADPPYRNDWETRILTALSASRAAVKETLVILETAIETPTDFVDEESYEVERIKDYKSNRHIFLRKR
ncbi:MAG: 16S rRNA (guanine(966)-N(2))-methyltransferase RsmD [Eubacterium sp.]|nr:16S rRNA (guanine(966)-N(2))-methyltransferase RsmD [Eubacterium sp.]